MGKQTLLLQRGVAGGDLNAAAASLSRAGASSAVEKDLVNQLKEAFKSMARDNQALKYLKNVSLEERKILRDASMA